MFVNVPFLILESSLDGTPRRQFMLRGSTKRKVESHLRKMGKVRIKLTDIIPFVWYAKMKVLYRHYRKRQRASRATEKAISYTKRLRLLIRKLKAGQQNERIREISPYFSTKAIQEKTVSIVNFQDDKEEEKSQLARGGIGTIKEVDLPARPLAWNVVATFGNKASRKKVVMRNRLGDGKIVSLRVSPNPATKVALGDIGYSNQNKPEGTVSDLRLSVSSVDASTETNDCDWDKDIASFASGSSFTRSLEEEYSSSIFKQTKQKSIEQSLLNTQSPGCVSQTICIANYRQINAVVDLENDHLIMIPKAVKNGISRGARRGASQGSGSERNRNISSHKEFCSRMADNGWCSSILESASKGWIDGFSCRLKPFERILHQRLSPSCVTSNLFVRQRDWKSEEKLSAAFLPKLVSVCGCAQRIPSWKETESAEVFVKRKVTRRNREAKAPNRRNKSMDEILDTNNEGFLKLSKVRDSVPVVKCSFDPYKDLRASMIEMIVNKKLHETQDLNELLHYYLSLNLPSHYDLIVRTFKDVWQEIFGNS